MKMTTVVVAIAVFLALTVCPGWSAEAKIGVVDMARVVGAFHETKSADSLLEKQVEELESEQRMMLAEREKLKKEFEDAHGETRNKALSEETREKKMEIAGEKLTDLREYERKIRERVDLGQRQLADQKARMQERIVSKLREIIGKYAEKNGYFLVLDSSGEGRSGVETVVYNLKGIDITEDVLKIIEKKD